MDMRAMAMGLSLLTGVPMLAVAQGFKCKLADGSLSFQEQPCPAGAVSSSMPSAPDSSGIGGAAPQPKELPGRPAGRRDPRLPPENKQQDAQRQRAEEEVNKHNQEVKAYNKMQRCNYARSQLGVAKEYKPIFRRDDKGERHYVEDGNRANVVAAAEQRVAAECN
ncbi:MAG: hypothetical protein ABI905_12675 [Betaproteobacteria bacterium]